MDDYNLGEQEPQENCITEYWTQEGSHKRKRKIDSDGFVCPTTPDIPRSSAYSNPDDQYIPIEGMASPMQEGLTAPMIEGIASPMVEGMTAPTMEHYPESFQAEDVYGNTELEAMDRTSMHDKVHEKGAAVLNSDLDTVIKGSKQNFCALMDHWSDIFRRSEEVGTLCVQKLDQCIQQASDVQHGLNQQKTALYHRLTSIGNALQVKSDQ